MTSSRLYNNIGIDALGISFVLEQKNDLPLSKLLLVAPIISHQALLNHLARKPTKILSFEKYLIENISYFSNFNDRYYSSLVSSMNAVQLLCELGVAKFDDGIIHQHQAISYQKSMGRRAEKISKAAMNISDLISENQEKTYLNLRIEL